LGTAEDLTAQFMLDCGVCCVFKAEAQFIHNFNTDTTRSIATWSYDFFLEFIELFRQEKCLRKVKSEYYFNSSKKDGSYRILIGKVQEVERDATRDTIVKNQQLAQRV